MSEEKRMLGNYEVVNSIYIGDKEVVFGVDKSDKYPFLVSYCDYHNPFGVPWATESVGCDDYLEAMGIFIQRVQSQIEQTKSELSKFAFDNTVFTKDHCIPDKRSSSIVGKVVVINAEPKRYEYQHPAFQLVLADGGNGATGGRGNAVFGTCLATGEKSRWERYDVLGEIKPECMPDWAKEALAKSRSSRKRKNRKIGRNADMEIRALTPAEQKYTYAQSMQLEGQTSNIGHLRGDFASSGYGFYTTWFDTRPQWKTDEFKKELDEVINSLREDKGLLHNRYDMSAFAKHYPESAFAGSYCTEYGFRVDTEKHAFLFRCNPTKGDYNFYCYCFVKEWLDKHIQKAEQGIRFIDPNYKELFRIPDGGKIIITSSWGEKTERPCRFIDEYHTEIGNNIFHICEFAERMEQNGATYEPKPTEPQTVTKAPKHKDLER